MTIQTWLPLLTLSSVFLTSSCAAIAKPLFSLEEAATRAQAQHSGFIVEVDLEDDLVWDVEFADATELDIDAQTGALIDSDRSDRGIVDLPSGVITVWNAVAIGRAAVPDSEPIEADLEFDDGRLEWSIDFRNDREVEIDASSGAILDGAD